MNTEKKYKKVFFERWTKDGYAGRWIYTQRHMRFSESDVPDLFDRRPYKQEEQRIPDYLIKVSEEGLHIALFYDGLPKDKKLGHSLKE